MVFFVLPFWKVFPKNIHYGGWASKPPQSTLILGEAWVVPFLSPPHSEPSRADFYIVILLFPATGRRQWL